MSDAPVNQRAQHVLKVLVERYIQDGSPIGSKVIADECALGLSPATIRHILSDLEEAGYLVSPHTSAGRVPTSMGYRFFVNSLLITKPFEGQEVTELKGRLDPDLALSHLIQSASTLLSGLTQMTGIVAMPKRNRIELRQVEFLPLSSNRVLVILVLNNREVQNRIIYTDRTYTQAELHQAANYINANYTGKDLLSIRSELSALIRHDRDDIARLLQAAVDVTSKAFLMDEKDASHDCAVAGQNHLLKHAEEVDVKRLRLLFDAVSQREQILNLLDHALDAEGVQIFIGKEAGHEAFDDCSIVTTSYAVDGRLVGSLGVIGPTRMPYDRVISAVDVTAKLLSAALNQG